MIDGREKQTSAPEESGSITGEKGAARRLTTTARHPRPSPTKKLESEASCSETSSSPPRLCGGSGNQQEFTDNLGGRRLPPGASSNSTTSFLSKLLLGLMHRQWQNGHPRELRAQAAVGEHGARLPASASWLDQHLEATQEVGNSSRQE